MYSTEIARRENRLSYWLPRSLYILRPAILSSSLRNSRGALAAREILSAMTMLFEMGLDFREKRGIWIKEVSNLGVLPYFVLRALPYFLAGPEKANFYYIIFFG